MNVPIVGLGGPRQRRGAAQASPPSLHSEVLRLQRTAGNRAVLQILRQPATTSGGTAAPTTGQTPAPPAQAKPPTVSPGRDENELIITRADGTRFHVRRRVRAQQVTNPGRTRAGFCHDDDRVWLRIAWCEGTQGTIDVGANPQGAIRDVVNTALGQINRGANLDQVKQTLENASIRPFAEAEIAQVGKWKITGDFSVDVSKAGGLGRRSGQIKGDIGWAQVGVEYSDTGTPTDGSQRDRRVDVNVTIPLSKRKVQGKKCQPPGARGVVGVRLPARAEDQGAHPRQGRDHLSRQALPLLRLREGQPAQQPQERDRAPQPDQPRPARQPRQPRLLADLDQRLHVARGPARRARRQGPRQGARVGGQRRAVPEARRQGAAADQAALHRQRGPHAAHADPAADRQDRVPAARDGDARQGRSGGPAVGAASRSRRSRATRSTAPWSASSARSTPRRTRA